MRLPHFDLASDDASNLSTLPRFEAPLSQDDAQNDGASARARLASSVGPTATSIQATVPSPGPPAILTIEELAAYLRLNHKTIRDAIGRGDIPGVRRIGGAVRIHRDTVLGWLASGQGRVVASRRSR